MNTKHNADLDELITQILADYQRPEDLIGSTGLLAQLTRRVIEKAMDVEMTTHLVMSAMDP
jgi:putative transposase